MSQHQIRIAVAMIILFGHIGIFLIGFIVLGVLDGNFDSDTLQIILMASPVLGATAVAASKYVLKNESNVRAGTRVDASFAVFVIAIPLLLISSILLLFLATYYRINNFGLDNLKISLGFLETFFAIFMTAISERLFGTEKSPRFSPSEK